MQINRAHAELHDGAGGEKERKRKELAQVRANVAIPHRVACHQRVAITAQPRAVGAQYRVHVPVPVGPQVSRHDLVEVKVLAPRCRPVDSVLRRARLRRHGARVITGIPRVCARRSRRAEK